MTPQMLQRVMQALDRDSETRGAPIGYYTGRSSREIRRGDPWSRNCRRLAIIIEDAPISGVQLALPPSPPQPRVVTGPPAAAAPRNSSYLGRELLGAGLNCTMAAFAGATVVGATAAEPATAGGSTPILLFAYAGFWSAGTSCLQSIRRVTEVSINQHDNSLDLEDANTSNIAVNNFVDAVGLASGFGEFGAGTQALMHYLEARCAMPTIERLRAVNQAERIRLTRAAIGRALRNADTSAEATRLLRAAGYDIAHGVGSRAGAARVVQLLSAQAARRIAVSVVQLINPLLAAVVSAQPDGALGSGSVRATINEFPGLMMHIVPRG